MAKISNAKELLSYKEELVKEKADANKKPLPSVVVRVVRHMAHPTLPQHLRKKL